MVMKNVCLGAETKVRCKSCKLKDFVYVCANNYNCFLFYLTSIIHSFLDTAKKNPILSLGKTSNYRSDKKCLMVASL